MGMGSFALYPMAFYQHQPVYICEDPWTLKEAPCTNVDFCPNL